MTERMGMCGRVVTAGAIAVLALAASGAQAQQKTIDPPPPRPQQKPSEPPAAAAPAASAAPAANAVEEVVVTAQRKREAAQTIPISISAFSAKSLEVQKIEGGPDLLKAIPNVTFTKTNFSGYNLTIRGIGTQAVSATTDPGVSVNFNGTSIIRNRLFEQEFFDLERVEVLRGPQGTLYGRNATAGAVNVISAKPTDVFSGELKVEGGSYGDKRVSGFLNVPLIDDKLDLRVAGAWTKRDGFDFNSTTGDAIDGRNLYSTRVTLGFKPSPRLRGNLIWEHFWEGDSRARSTKQLCTRDPGPTSIGNEQNLSLIAQAFLSQGCQDASLYSPAAYGTPNGLSLPYVLAGVQNTEFIGLTRHGFDAVQLLKVMDPYGGLMQSPDLRTIASQFDPIYKAKNDIIELNFDYELTPQLTFTSETAYSQDHYHASEDYNRFTTIPGVFNTTTGLVNAVTLAGPAPRITPNGGIFCDPQLGCSNTIEGLDISQANSHQFSQEFRLASSFGGPFNFSVGANYTLYRTVEDYYVFFNVLTAIAQSHGAVGNYSGNFTQCYDQNGVPQNVVLGGNVGCIYIDPNRRPQVNGEGHNYFLSENPYSIHSGAAFGEVYYKITPDLKLTGGLRYTDDSKIFTPIPTQLLLNSTNGGTVDSGYPASPDIRQHWGAVTGRIALDWSPRIPFTDQTLLYASYNRGYKGGGANPPAIGYNTQTAGGGQPPTQLTPFPATFLPEYVNAFEIGAKNTLLGGTLVLNFDAFYDDYSDYQVSQIENDTAVNQNFNAKIWGAEFESVWQANHHLRFTAALGYQDSSLARGSLSIDVENRTQGNPNFVTLKGNEFLPDNCVVSVSYIANLIASNRALGQPDDANLLGVCPGTFLSQFLANPPTAADLPNGGQGFFADVSGHNLPNQPHFTQSVGADYTVWLPEGWEAVLHGDFYHQTSSWARIYQDPVDRLQGWSNINLRLTLSRPSWGLEFEVYVKNLLNSSPITGAFVNSENTALTVNVFTLDPRIIGASIRKRF